MGPQPTPDDGPPKPCEARGPVLVRMRGVANGDVKDTKEYLADITVYETGAWRMPNAVPGGVGCLDAAARARIVSEIDAAKWTKTPAAAACDAVSAYHTEYTVRGQLVYSIDVCASVVLDKTSQRAIDDLHTTLAFAWVPPGHKH